MAKQRIAVVTGGMGGLGETISTKMADAGYRVVVTYSPSNTKFRSWLEEMKGRGYSFGAFPIDVVDYDDCARKTRDDPGGGGRGRHPRQQCRHHARHDVQEDEQGRLGRGDAHQPRLVLQHDQAGVDGMVERGWGRVINVSSVNGQKGAFGQTNYSAAKAGMHGFTKALALEVARKGVTVNTISPGYIGTKMVTAIPKEILDTKILPQIPIGRLGKPEEVAGLVIYLCSEEAAFVTGANIAINGGQHMY